MDTFLSRVIDQLRDKKAIVIYAADHGESINEKEHLHGTPRKLAPPEQFRVPMIMWMSDKYGKSGQSQNVCPSETAGRDQGTAPSR